MGVNPVPTGTEKIQPGATVQYNCPESTYSLLQLPRAGSLGSLCAQELATTN